MVSQIIMVVIRGKMIGVFVVRFVSLRNEDDDTQFSSLRWSNFDIIRACEECCDEM
jgi:hypothetical protein